MQLQRLPNPEDAGQAVCAQAARRLELWGYEASVVFAPHLGRLHYALACRSATARDVAQALGTTMVVTRVRLGLSWAYIPG